MHCPICDTADTRVIETRQELDGFLVRRRHECANEHRFNSYQYHETVARAVGIGPLRDRVRKLQEVVARRGARERRKAHARNLISGGMQIRAAARKVGIHHNTAQRLAQESRT